MPKIVTELPGPKAREYIEKSRQFEPQSMSDQVPLVWDKAEGCVITDVDGNEFLDWSSGVLVTNVGHCHPHYVEEVKDQADKLFNCYDFLTAPRANLAEKLVNVSPDHLDKVFLVTTGSDATEAAMRMARRAHDGFEIISFHGAFHGRTYGAASAAGSMGTKKGYGPMMTGFLHSPFPYCYRCPFGLNAEDCGYKCLEYLDWKVARESCDELCAVITEPYQGGAGSIIPPPGWFEGLDKWIKSRGLYLIFDEVQSSFGRTGTMFAMEHWDIKPDLVTLGKGLGSGIPCSAVLGTSEIMDVLPPGSMGSTNGGNPMSSRAALAAINIIEDENLVQNSANMGEKFEERFEAIAQKHEELGDIRGMGLVWGLEFVKDAKSREPDPELTRRVVEEAYQRGLCMIAPIGLYGNVARVAPPLVITDEEADESLDLFEAALEAALEG
ncbi:MAG: aspartate aminotransferase family protein [Armatimonadota bacterium]